MKGFGFYAWLVDKNGFVATFVDESLFVALALLVIIKGLNSIFGA